MASKHIDWQARTVRIELFILLVGCALLLGAVSLYLGFAKESQASLKDRIDNTKYQAVFLNIGGVGQQIAYFGKIADINDKYMVLQDVFSVTQQQAQDSQSAVPQLVKLGCQQLHSPYDQMVINQNQIAYWENIKDDGKLVQAIKDFKKKNPNGPNCSAQNPSAGQTPAPANN